MSGFLQDLRFELEPEAELTVVLTRSLVYLDGSGVMYTIPEGFRCDLASVPRIFRSVATPWHQSARAGILHDCIYRWAIWWGVTRSESDELYRQALVDDEVSRWRAWVQKRGVRLGGWRSWNRWRKVPPDKKGVQPPRLTRIGRKP